MVSIVNRALCAVLALAALVGGLVVAAEIVVAGFERGPWLIPYDRWDRFARATPWSDADVRLAGAAMLTVGIAILAVQLVRRRPSALALSAASGGTPADLDRRGAEWWLSERAGQVVGVVEAGVSVGRAVVVVRARSLDPDTAAVEGRLRDEVSGGLQALGVDHLRVKVEVKRRTAP